jgi:hypothetical protein
MRGRFALRSVGATRQAATSTEGFIYRLSSSLALGGVFLIVVAMVCWFTGGSATDAVQSVHHVGAVILASMGVVCLGTGIALAQQRANDGPT